MVEHTKIIDALAAADRDGAAAAMARHIARGTDAAVSAMFSPSAGLGAAAAARAAAAAAASQPHRAVKIDALRLTDRK
jgi:hypothetical protein